MHPNGKQPQQQWQAAAGAAARAAVVAGTGRQQQGVGGKAAAQVEQALQACLMCPSVCTLPAPSLHPPCTHLHHPRSRHPQPSPT